LQTFLPSTKGVSENAKLLDNKRLNKQALEAWQILMVLTELDPEGFTRKPKGWANHPAVKMWRGHEYALAIYAIAMVEEWKSRGYNSTIGDKVVNTLTAAVIKGSVDLAKSDFPEWMEDPEQFEAIASTHRTALLAKDYEWYSQFGWPEDTGSPISEYEYIWPVN